jgi:hypothetical protein
LCHGLAGSGQTDSRSPQRRAALKRLLSWGERMSIFFKPVRSAIEFLTSGFLDFAQKSNFATEPC